MQAAGSTRRKARHNSTAKAGAKTGLNKDASGGSAMPAKTDTATARVPCRPSHAERSHRRLDAGHACKAPAAIA